MSVAIALLTRINGVLVAVPVRMPCEECDACDQGYGCPYMAPNDFVEEEG